MAEKEKKSIEGQWVKLAGVGDGVPPLTSTDLDDMVRNFQPESEAEHIPVHFGKPNSGGPVLAQISALKRDGSALSAKLEKVDPRADQMYQAGKLGGRTYRSLAFARTPESGATLTGYGFAPPRVYSAGANRDGETTDAALSKLAADDTAGEVIQFAASDAGWIEIIMETLKKLSPWEILRRNSQKLSDLATTRQQARNISFGEALKQVAAEHPSLTAPNRARPVAARETLHFETNSEKLSDLAKQRARAEKISFGEALSACAAENPHLTLPDRIISFGDADGPRSNSQRLRDGETFRFQTNSEALSELAKQRQREDKISFGEALSACAAENPHLTLPDGVISFKEDAPRSNSQQLSDLATKRAREDKITFGEALSQVAAEFPLLTLRDTR